MKIYDRYRYYEIILYYIYKENKISHHLLMHIDEGGYEYLLDVDYIIPGYLYITYLPLPDDAQDNDEKTGFRIACSL